MRVKMRGTRGSLPTPGPRSVRYGGNTSCVEVRTAAGGLICLDAGTGIGDLQVDPAETLRVDILLTHLHMDHILGLGFFSALFSPDLEVHIWGPGSTTLDLRRRLARYLSPPLFPVRLRDLPCRLELHDVPLGTFDLPDAEVTAALVCHPGPTVGFRLDDGTGTLCYLPDHEPALGVRRFPEGRAWTSGIGVADEVDVLIHDAQYDDDEYREHVGWGHSSIRHAMALADLSGARRLLGFHHDPSHDDDCLDRLLIQAMESRPDGVDVSLAVEGACLTAGA